MGAPPPGVTYILPADSKNKKSVQYCICLRKEDILLPKSQHLVSHWTRQGDKATTTCKEASGSQYF